MSESVRSGLAVRLCLCARIREVGRSALLTTGASHGRNAQLSTQWETSALCSVCAFLVHRYTHSHPSAPSVTCTHIFLFRTQALAMNAELNTQNKQLDRVGDKTDSNIERVERGNVRATNILKNA